MTETIFGTDLQRYDVIEADPPWPHQSFGQKKHGAAKAHYDEQTYEWIESLRVANYAETNCALALWASAVASAEGKHVEVMEAWGFRPVAKLFHWRKVYDICECGHDKTAHAHAAAPPNRSIARNGLCLDDVIENVGHHGGCFACLREFLGRVDVIETTWQAKQHGHYAAFLQVLPCSAFRPRPYCGLGFYTRSEGEDCWLGIKGGGFTPERHDVYTEIEAPVTVHSAKPPEVVRRIEALWPNAKKLELFCRGTPRPGWHGWGNECEGEGAVDLDLVPPGVPVAVQGALFEAEGEDHGKHAE